MTSIENNPTANTVNMLLQGWLCWEFPCSGHIPCIIVLLHRIPVCFEANSEWCVPTIACNMCLIARGNKHSPWSDYGSLSYNTFKTRVINQMSESQRKRIHQLLTSEELSDRTPFQLLQRMKHLLGDEILPFPSVFALEHAGRPNFNERTHFYRGTSRPSW